MQQLITNHTVEANKMVPYTYASKMQLAAIGAMCAKLGINKDAKAAMVAGYSNGRCDSSKFLYFNEARQMCNNLNTLCLQTQDTTNRVQERQKMLGKIFYCCHELGWVRASKSTGKPVADGKRFDQWAVKYSYLKKKLNQYSYKELPKLVSQVKKLYESGLQKR